MLIEISESVRLGCWVAKGKKEDLTNVAQKKILIELNSFPGIQIINSTTK